MDIINDANLSEELTEYEILYHVNKLKRSLETRLNAASTIREKSETEADLARVGEVLELLEDEEELEAPELLLLVKVYELEKRNNLWADSVRGNVIDALHGNRSAALWVDSQVLQRSNANEIRKEWRRVLNIEGSSGYTGNYNGEEQHSTGSGQSRSSTEGTSTGFKDPKTSSAGYSHRNAGNTATGFKSSQKNSSSGGYRAGGTASARGKGFLNNAGDIFRDSKGFFTKKRIVAIVIAGLILFGISELGIISKNHSWKKNNNSQQSVEEVSGETYTTDNSSVKTEDNGQETEQKEEKKNKKLIDLQTEKGPSVLPIDQVEISERSGFVFTEENETDTIGNTFSGPNLALLTSNGNSSQAGYVDYYLGGQYKTIAGIVAISDRSSSTRGNLRIFTREDENMDWKLIYEREGLYRGTAPFELNIDLANTNWIKIEFYPTGSEWSFHETTLILSEITLYAGEAEAVSLPNPKHSETIGLEELKATVTHGYEVATAAVKDIVGNVYENPYPALLTSSGNSSQAGFADFYLGGQYKTIAGIVAISENSSSTRGNLQLYTRVSDDTDWELIYEREGLDRGTAPFELNVDIGNPNWLRIKFDPTASEWSFHETTLILSQVKLYTGEAETIVLPTQNGPREIDLDELKAVNNKNFEFSAAKKTDTYGNTYNYRQAENVALLSGNRYNEGYADFYLGSNYSALSGLAGVEESSGDGTLTLQFYIRDEDDWVLLNQYESISRATMPFDINLSLNQPAWIRIALSDMTSGDDTTIILSGLHFS